MDPDGFDVVIARLGAGSIDTRASEAWLSDDERQRARRFIRDRDRSRFVEVRSRLRQLIGARLGVPADSIELSYGDRGKPRIAAGSVDCDLRFNVSHCGDVAAFAFAVGREIGIDVEAVRTLTDADDIAAMVFSRRELDVYSNLGPCDRTVGFFNCWTRKEAFVKAVGDGLQYPLDRFDVSLAPREPARLLSVDGVPGSQCGWTLHAFRFGPGLIGAVAVEAPCTTDTE